MRIRPWLLAAAAPLALLAIALSLSAPASATLPPFASINLPINGSAYNANTTIAFYANDTSDPDANSTLDFIWNFSGEIIQGIELRAVFYSNFSVPGLYTVMLTVRDNESLEGYDDVTVRIDPENHPPVPVIAAPQDGARFFTNEFVTFSAAGSYDPDGEPLNYTWSSVKSGTNLSVVIGFGINTMARFSAGSYRVTLLVEDNRTGENSTSINITAQVNTPPRLVTFDPAPPVGIEGDSFLFRATYFEDNGEPAASLLLIVDGSPYPMAWVSGSDPVAGQTYETSLVVAAGRHAFYFLASDGNLTNLSATLAGPDVWQHLTVVSPDRYAVLQALVLPPQNLSITVWHGQVPVDPSDLLAISAAYLVDGNFLDAANVSLSFAYNPPAGVNRSSALLFRAAPDGVAWLALVTTIDDSANTASLSAPTAEVPFVYRVYARRLAAPPNLPPTPVIGSHGLAQPNSTMELDASGSSDPENATLVFWWRLEGPGLLTDWVPGEKIQVAFPESGHYNVTLRVDDGSGNIVYGSSVVDVKEPQRVIPPPSDEAAALAALAIAVAVSAVLAMWWRSRTPARKKSYEDLYGRAYKQRFVDELEYNQLFERYAEPEGAMKEAPPAEDE